MQLVEKLHAIGGLEYRDRRFITYNYRIFTVFPKQIRIMVNPNEQFVFSILYVLQVKNSRQRVRLYNHYISKIKLDGNTNVGSTNEFLNMVNFELGTITKERMPYNISWPFRRPKAFGCEMNETNMTRLQTAENSNLYSEI